MIDSVDPDYGSGGSSRRRSASCSSSAWASWRSAPCVMFIWQARDPAFFRGETLKHDTPSLIVED